MLQFFKFLQKKVYWLKKTNFMHLLNESRGFATWFLQITTPKVVHRCLKIFCQARKLFSAEIWKITACHFWADVMSRQPRIQASRASPAQKSRGLRVISSSTFEGLHFLFSCPLSWSMYIWAICPWNKFHEKAQCEPVMSPIIILDLCYCLR